MRLTTLTLQRYGPFADTRITLDPAPGRLTLLVARNGAGKSVLRQAFSDLLFGIGGQSPMGFRHGYAGMSLQAELLGPDGTPAALVRRKGQGNTLAYAGADAQGLPVPPAALAALLGPADRRLLERLFSLDTRLLRAGGDELLASGGELGDALLAATGELHAAREQLEALDRQRDEVAPLRRHERRPFYRGLDALAASRKARREVRRPEEWRRREAEAAAAEAAQAAANAAERAASVRLALLERTRRTAPILAECDAAQAWLAAHPDAPVLPDGEPQRLAQRLGAAREAQARGADALAEARRRHEAAARMAAAVVPDAALLAQAEALAALADMAGAARQAEGDLPAVAGENAAAVTRIAGLLRALGAEVPVAQAAALVPSRPARAEAARLIERHGELAGRMERLPGLIATRTVERAALAAGQAALPGTQPQDGEPLEPLLREVGREGDPAAQLATVSARLHAAQAAAAAALARLPAAADAVPPLACTPAALERSLERLDAARLRGEVARTAARAHRDRLVQLCDMLLAITTALADGEAAADEPALPDAAALAAARRHRDAGWHLVFRQSYTPAPPDPVELAAWAGAEPLPLAYARAVAAADRLADRRMAEAQRVAEAAALERERAHTQAALDAAQAETDAAAGPEAAALADWLAVAAPLGLGAGATPAELQGALAAREAALAALAEARLAGAEAEALQRRHAGWAARLARVLPDAGTRDLPALLALAEARQARTRIAEAERARLGGQAQAVEGQLDTMRADLAEATRTLDAWNAEWAAALHALGRPAGEPPHATATALGLLAELETAVADAAQREERQEGMRSRLARFDAAARHLAERLGSPAAPGEEAFALARRLGDALVAAQGVQARRGELDLALAAARAGEERAEQALREAGGALAAVLAAVPAGPDADPAQAAARLALAEEAGRHRTLVREAMARLGEAGDGLEPAELRAAAAGIDREALPAEAEAARTAQRAAAEAAQAAARAAALLREALAREAEAEPQAAAAEAAALAGIGTALEDALLLHAAGALLRHGLQRLEAEADTTLVRRIGTAFSTLTAGEYDVALAPGTSGDALVLREHAHPQERRQMRELSEGTRDQLYLALRLVAIEDHVRAAPALPFLADDILQTFDDRRATATLQALVALSRCCQVIVLTHHEHLVGLAEGLPVSVQRL